MEFDNPSLKVTLDAVRADERAKIVEEIRQYAEKYFSATSEAYRHINEVADFVERVG